MAKDAWRVNPTAERVATATTDSTILLIDKDRMVRMLPNEHALSDRFIAHMLARNIRIEEDFQRLLLTAVLHN